MGKFNAVRSGLRAGCGDTVYQFARFGLHSGDSDLADKDKLTKDVQVMTRAKVKPYLKKGKAEKTRNEF